MIGFSLDDKKEANILPVCAQPCQTIPHQWRQCCVSTLSSCALSRTRLLMGGSLWHNSQRSWQNLLSTLPQKNSPACCLLPKFSLKSYIPKSSLWFLALLSHGCRVLYISEVLSNHWHSTHSSENSVLQTHTAGDTERLTGLPRIRKGILGRAGESSSQDSG